MSALPERQWHEARVLVSAKRYIDAAAKVQSLLSRHPNLLNTHYEEAFSIILQGAQQQFDIKDEFGANATIEHLKRMHQHSSEASSHRHNSSPSYMVLRAQCALLESRRTRMREEIMSTDNLSLVARSEEPTLQLLKSLPASFPSEGYKIQAYLIRGNAKLDDALQVFDEYKGILVDSTAWHTLLYDSFLPLLTTTSQTSHCIRVLFYAAHNLARLALAVRPFNLSKATEALDTYNNRLGELCDVPTEEPLARAIRHEYQARYFWLYGQFLFEKFRLEQANPTEATKSLGTAVLAFRMALTYVVAQNMGPSVPAATASIIWSLYVERFVVVSSFLSALLRAFPSTMLLWNDHAVKSAFEYNTGDTETFDMRVVNLHKPLSVTALCEQFPASFHTLFRRIDGDQRPLVREYLAANPWNLDRFVALLAGHVCADESRNVLADIIGDIFTELPSGITKEDICVFITLLIARRHLQTQCSGPDFATKRQVLGLGVLDALRGTGRATEHQSTAWLRLLRHTSSPLQSREVEGIRNHFMGSLHPQTFKVAAIIAEAMPNSASIAKLIKSAAPEEVPVVSRDAKVVSREVPAVSSETKAPVEAVVSREVEVENDHVADDAAASNKDAMTLEELNVEPVEKTQVEEIEKQVEETPAEVETPVQMETTAQVETAVQETPAQETTVQETPAQVAPVATATPELALTLSALDTSLPSVDIATPRASSTWPSSSLQPETPMSMSSFSALTSPASFHLTSPTKEERESTPVAEPSSTISHRQKLLERVTASAKKNGMFRPLEDENLGRSSMGNSMGSISMLDSVPLSPSDFSGLKKRV